MSRLVWSFAFRAVRTALNASDWHRIIYSVGSLFTRLCLCALGADYDVGDGSVVDATGFALSMYS